MNNIRGLKTGRKQEWRKGMLEINEAKLTLNFTQCYVLFDELRHMHEI